MNGLIVIDEISTVPEITGAPIATTRCCQLGKDMTSPNYPRETQPHFFESKTDELIRMVMLNKQVSA